MSTGRCNRRPWVGPSRHRVEDAQNDTVWHVYETHHLEWVSVVGSRPPLVHDPRTVN